MLPAPRASLAPNTAEFETLPLVKPTGFREYDARWWFGIPSSDKAPELNLLGVQALGLRAISTNANQREAYGLEITRISITPHP